MLNMDYFASTSLSKLKKMIDAEKDATIKPTIKQKLLVVWHKKKGETEKGIEEILLVPKSVGTKICWYQSLLWDIWSEGSERRALRGLREKENQEVEGIIDI
jgi:hypothetical protein